MHKIILSLFLLFMQFSMAQIKNKPITELNTELSDGEVLIDVRTPGEFEEGHIKGALNINVKDESFTDKINAIDKNKIIYLYCKGGKRSARASKILSDLGYQNIVNLEGGFDDWIDAGKQYENRSVD